MYPAIDFYKLKDFNEICIKFINDSDTKIGMENNWIDMMTDYYIINNNDNIKEVYLELEKYLNNIELKKSNGFLLNIYNQQYKCNFDLYVLLKNENNNIIITICHKNIL
jgi:hypothetical protein